MLYKYITVNNLIDKQNYMYSEYGGSDFLNEYRQIRERGIAGLKNQESWKEKIHVSYDELCQIRKWCQGGKAGEAKEAFDLYLKAFEVRKRLYTEYDNLWKPVENAGYENYETYLVFAECLIVMYRQTRCMKYLSCLLKCNDTMLSVCRKFTNRQKGLLADILKGEVEIYDEIVAGISGNEETCQ